MKQSGLYSVVTVGEAAVYLSLTPRRVRQLCEAGKLASRRANGGWLINLDSVIAYKEQSRACNN